MTPLAPKFLDLEPKQFSDPELENLKGSDLLNGTLRTLEGCQNFTKEHRALFYFLQCDRNGQSSNYLEI